MNGCRTTNLIHNMENRLTGNLKRGIIMNFGGMCPELLFFSCRAMCFQELVLYVNHVVYIFIASLEANSNHETINKLYVFNDC